MIERFKLAVLRLIFRFERRIHKSFLFLHLILFGCFCGSLLIWYLWFFSNSEITLFLVGTYLAIFAMIEDARRSFSIEVFTKQLHRFTDVEWEILSSIKNGFSTIAEIEKYVQVRLGTTRAQIFSGISALVRREYIRSNDRNQYVLTGMPFIQPVGMDRESS
jgi:hypothetical protein